MFCINVISWEYDWELKSLLDALYLWKWDDGAGLNLILGALFADLVI